MADNRDQGGDLRPDLESLFRDYGALVMRTVRRMGTAEKEVEDVAQEVFLVLHRRLSDYDPSRPIRPWIYGIAMRTALAQRRRAYHRRVQIGEPLPTLSVEPDQERAVRRAEARALLDHALDQLDDDKRAVFVAFDLEGIPMKEVADALGCPLQTAYSRLHAARRAVRAAVEEHGRSTRRSAS